MQNKILSVLVAATLVTCGARAQDAAANSAPAPASQPAAVAASNSQTAPAPNQVIYAPRLPSPAELTSAAAAQGLSVEQINQTATQITVVYRYNNGQTNTVAYQLLPTQAPTTTTTTTVVVPNPAPTVVYQNPAPTVVYETSPSVIYYDTYRPYYYRPYYPPVSLSFGFGYYHGWGGGGYHGGHHWR